MLKNYLKNQKLPMLKKIFIFLIKIYQKTLSPDHGPLKKVFPHGYCRFHPTCSQYTIDAIEKNGVILGTLIGFWRINRCNPWSKGGNDKAETATIKQAFYGFLMIITYILISFMLFLLLEKLINRG
ncbi:membrane protein insertion efficiency factor YidD [bacterium]|nr:membrane protein insertion efficiency factor YidD [bacterium]